MNKYANISMSKDSDQEKNFWDFFSDQNEQLDLQSWPPVCRDTATRPYIRHVITDLGSSNLETICKFFGVAIPNEEKQGEELCHYIYQQQLNSEVESNYYDLGIERVA